MEIIPANEQRKKNAAITNCCGTATKEMFYKSKSNEKQCMQSSERVRARRKEPANSLSYRFEIYLCTNHLLFFLTWRLYLYAHPACLPFFPFSSIPSFVLSSKTYNSELFFPLYFFLLLFIHSSYLFCAFWPSLYPPLWCVLAYLLVFIKCILCRKESGTMNNQTKSERERENIDLSVLYMDAVAAGSPIYYGYCWSKKKRSIFVRLNTPLICV